MGNKHTVGKHKPIQTVGTEEFTEAWLKYAQSKEDLMSSKNARKVLQALAEIADMAWDKEAADKFIQMIDVNHDGEISYDEFYQFLLGTGRTGEVVDMSKRNLEKFPTDIDSDVSTLDVSQNNIYEIPEDFLPKLQHLEELILSSNVLTSIPQDIPNCKSLTSLQLADNKLFMYPLPKRFGELVQLQSLDLSGNKLEAIPPSFGFLTSLTYLDVSRNQLKELPQVLYNAHSLKALRASKNSFTGLHPGINKGWPVLNILELNENKIKELPEEIGELGSLRILNMDLNNLQGLPASIVQLTSLVELNLSSNPKLLKLCDLSSFKKLKTLSLIGTKLRTIDASIGTLSSLECLELRDSLLLEGVPTEIGRLFQLRELDLTHMDLTSLPPTIGRLTNLNILLLAYNKFTVATLPSAISKLVSLKELEISFNKLNGFPPELVQLEELISLDLSNNKIPAIPTEISQLTNLRTLRLHDNELSVLPPQISALTSLQTLDIHHNGLGALPPEIGYLTNLKKIDIANNFLSDLPWELGNLRNCLEVLVTAHNTIKVPPPDIVEQGTRAITTFLAHNEKKARAAGEKEKAKEEKKERKEEKKGKKRERRK